MLHEAKTPDTLYGVKDYLGFAPDGSISAETYYMGIPANQVMSVQGPGGPGDTILAFFDHAKRDAFHAIFGGVKVTMHKQSVGILTGAKAMAAAKKMGQ